MIDTLILLKLEKEGIEIRRVILDTNVFEKIIEYEERGLLKKKIKRRRDRIIIYGIRNVIRKELREVPSRVKVRKAQLRLALLSVYDDLIGEHELNIVPVARFLAKSYFEEYRRNRGSQGWKKMENDFLIVACATINHLDIVVSEDEATMLSKPALRAYEIVNRENNYEVPEFLSYEKFRKL